MQIGGITSEMGRDQFLQLLVTQLRNQDPLDPVSNEDMVAQLAQFSALEGIEKLNASFEDMLKLNQLTQGASLIGRTATFVPPGTADVEVAPVDGFSLQDGSLRLVIDGMSVPLDNIRQISG